MLIRKKTGSLAVVGILLFGLVACSSASKSQASGVQGSIEDPIFAITRLTEHQQQWQGTRYRLGGADRNGVDCSGFMQITFRDLFGIRLPRTTTDQAKKGKQVAKSELRTGDLVFFKTGRGPNAQHVGVYVRDGLFLHASTKGGVIYSNMNTPYWTRTFWQARRL